MKRPSAVVMVSSDLIDQAGLLSANSVSGKGEFSRARFIQRLRTIGGGAPRDGCEQASAGTEARVSDSAEYWFYACGP